MLGILLAVGLATGGFEPAWSGWDNAGDAEVRPFAATRPVYAGLLGEANAFAVSDTDGSLTYDLDAAAADPAVTNRPGFFVNLGPRTFYNAGEFYFGRFRHDAAKYRAWRAKHSGFRGFLTLEWVNDCLAPIDRPKGLQNPRRRNPLTDGELADLVARTPVPKTRREFVDVNLKTHFDRIVEISFGDPKAVLIGDGSDCVGHLAAHWGAGAIAIETTRDHLFYQRQMIFCRGAARQFGIPWMWYVASYIDGSRDGKYVSNCRLAEELPTWKDAGPNFGISLSAVKRATYMGYLSGANYYEREATPSAHFLRGKPPVRLSDEGEMFETFVAFTRETDRGEPYQPIALLVPHDRGYTRFGGAAFRRFAYTHADYMLDAVMATILENHRNNDPDDLSRHQERVMANSKYGDFYDAITPDFEDDPTFAPSLDRYRAAILFGETLRPEKRRILIDWVRRGGTLVLSSAQLSDDWAGTGEESVLLRNARGGAVFLSRACGKGRLIVGAKPYLTDWPQDEAGQAACLRSVGYHGTARFPELEWLIGYLTDAFVPVKVGGDVVQYGLNGTRDGWLLYLVNNGGVTKEWDKEPVFDPRPASVRVELGDFKSEVAVPSGEVVTLKIPKRACAQGGGYEALRAELRAFYPDECHSPCKLAAQTNSVQAIARGIDAFVAAHPEADALDIRRASYLEMRKHFVPILFRNLPFYFEAGVNGGWSIWSGDKAVPSRHVNAVCRRFYKEKGLIPASALDLLHERTGNGRLIVCCGPFVDDQHHVPPFHAIFTRGFGGVRDDVAAALAKCPADDPLGRKELETALVGLDTIHEIQLSFAESAKERVKGLGEGEERKRMLRIADSAQRCPWEPPRTFFEGLNTLWFVREILGYVDGVCNFSLGRPDAWLIDFYRADLAAGRLTKDEAKRLVDQFLIASDCHLDDRLFLDRPSDQEAEMPLTLGGCDARGADVWNELTEMFLDAHLAQDLVFPKLHCRMSEKSPQAYLEKIGDMLLRDHAVFALFNDDRHLANFQTLGVPLERARDYVGTGCWDGNVDTYTDVDCANYVSVARILEMTIHRNPEEERRFRVKIDPIDGASSYEDVEETVYRNFIRFFRDVLGEYTRYGRANAQVFPHPTYSMCLDGCIESRRDTTDGGTAFRPRVVTLAFMANVVDSLCAIRKVCFEDRAATLDEFLAAVRSNWAGEEGRRLRGLAMSAPYWGDNTEASTSLMRRWIDRIHDDIAGLRNDQGGPYVLACWIYREFVNWGALMKATPDGRHDGDRLAQGFAPSEFRCKESASAVIGALGKLDHSKLYASNANLMFEKDGVNPEVFAAIFRVACASGMHLLQPNCASVADLLDAQVHPERHQNIIVKVCGFSARFITLSKRWQDEIIARHRLK